MAVGDPVRLDSVQFVLHITQQILKGVDLGNILENIGRTNYNSTHGSSPSTYGGRVRHVARGVSLVSLMALRHGCSISFQPDVVTSTDMQVLEIYAFVSLAAWNRAIRCW